MSLAVVYAVVAGVDVVLWLPILVRFYRAWRVRGNPVSLTICGIIFLLVWTTVGGLWLLTDSVDHRIVVFATAFASIAIAIASHYAFHWAKTRFPDQRGK